MANLQITEYLNQFLPPEDRSITEEIGEEVNLPLEERPATEEIGEEIDLTALASGYQKFAKVPKTTVAQDQADRIKLLIDAGKDETGTPFIYRYYEPQIGRGTLGEVGSVLERATRKDLIPPEVEALLGEEYITKLIKVLGSPEFTTPRQDATFAQAAITRAVGRQGAEETEAEKIAAARGGSLGYFSRLISEWGGKTPTQEEMAGIAPAGASPAVAELYKQYKYSPATSRVAEDIDFKYYGRLPVRDKEAFREDTDRANQAIRWMSQLPAGVNDKGEKISVAEDVVGQFLVADINARYGTKDKQYTLEELDLKIAPTSRGNQLTFMHPTEGRQPIDPVAFEWGDVIDELPGLSVVLADIGGSLAGGLVTAKGGPAAMFLGSTAGGAAGSGIAKWFAQDRALRLGGFTYDGSKNGFVGKNAAGKNIVIPAMDIAMGSISEAAWSAGGATLGSALFKVFRSLFTRGASQVEEFMNEKDFLDAYKRYGESKWGQKFREEGLPVPPAVQMESSANLIRQDARNAIPGEKEKLLAQAVRLENAAAGLRELEKTGTIPKAGEARAAIQDRLEREVEGGIRRSYFDTPEKFGKAVESALRNGDGAEILALIRLQKVDNANLIADWTNRFIGVDEIGDPRVFGESLREASAKILGTQTDNAGVTRTGLYGALNIIRARGQQHNRAVWDLTSIATGVEKQIKALKKVGTPAYPPKIQKYFDELRQNSRGGELRVTLPQLKALDDLINQEIKSTGGEAQRKLFNLSANLRKAEGEGFKRIDGSLFKEWQEAHQSLKDFRESVLNTSINKMSEGNMDEVAEHLFRSFRDDKIIFETLGDLNKMGAFGQKQKDLLKNILKAKYRRSIERPLGPEEGPLIAAERRQVAIGAERFQQQTLEAGQHDAFVREYGPWLRVLFPEDPELDKFARVIAQSEDIKGGYAKIAKMEKDLRGMSWLKNQKFDDISRIAIEEPNKLFDIALSSEFPSRAVKELKGVLKKGFAASPERYKVAEERMKALALRRIWDPGDSFAGTKTGGTTLPKVTGESLGVLEKDRDAFIEIFGEKKYNNLRELFTQMNALANPPSRAIPGASFLKLQEKETSWLARVAMLPVKVWVGVLNKKARALNQLSKIQSKGAETKFERLLTDSDALARALKIRRTVKGRLAVNALSSALAVSEDEAQNLIDEYTTINAQGEIIPVPVITPREGRAEALQALQ